MDDITIQGLILLVICALVVLGILYFLAVTVFAATLDPTPWNLFDSILFTILA